MTRLPFLAPALSSREPFHPTVKADSPGLQTQRERRGGGSREKEVEKKDGKNHIAKSHKDKLNDKACQRGRESERGKERARRRERKIWWRKTENDGRRQTEYMRGNERGF